MWIKIIIFFAIFIIAFFIYKFISFQLEKSTDESKRIIKECKTEEEQIKKLNTLKKINIKRAIICYFVFIIVFIIVGIFLLLILRSINH